MSRYKPYKTLQQLLDCERITGESTEELFVRLAKGDWKVLPAMVMVQGWLVTDEVARQLLRQIAYKVFEPESSSCEGAMYRMGVW